MTRRAGYAGAAVALIAIGLLTRLPIFGLSGPFAKYTGSILWGAMVYCVVGFCQPYRSLITTALIAAVIATGVEFSQLWHTDWLDGFRRTTIGVLLIGRYFSWGDILAYAIGIASAMSVDRFFTPSSPTS